MTKKKKRFQNDRNKLNCEFVGVSFTSFCVAMEKERRKSKKLARLKRVRSRLVSRPFSSSSNESTPISVTSLSSVATHGHRRNSSSDNRRGSLHSVPQSPPIEVSKSQLQIDPTTCESKVSAENVALSLLGHFSQLRLPHESDMEWLVSENDAPQHVGYISKLILRIFFAVLVVIVLGKDFIISVFNPSQKKLRFFIWLKFTK